MTTAANLAQYANNSPSWRNRIINGAMVIDQRNAGASVTNNNTGTQYSLDRWLIYGNNSSKFTVQRNAGSVTPPAGFSNYLGVTSSAATTVGSGDIYEFIQYIEGFNTADLAWGTANAQTVTVSFWVRSSLTGTFGGALQNSGATRSYPFSYTISAANTWEQKSITIAGDTTGTWLTNNGIGISLVFSLGMGSTYSSTAGSWQAGLFLSTTGATSVVGTSGATFYITGVQLEKGTTATNFEYRDYGRELIMCQRYYEQTWDGASAATTSGARGCLSQQFNSVTYLVVHPSFQVSKRAAPTVTIYSPGGTSGKVWSLSDVDTGAGIVANNIGTIGFRYLSCNVTNVGAAGTFTYHYSANAEL
jgi:hypothetical protein